MPRSATEGFNVFLTRLTPSASEREKAASHRSTIYSKLDSSFGLHRMFETGSFKHGTGVSGHSDLDLLASLKSNKPALSSSTLAAVRDALKERFPNTYIHASRPAVVLEFGSGYERVEVLPAFASESVTDGMKFNVPGVTSEWLESTPEAHLKYVNECNNGSDIKGGTKGLARLVKAWKYYRNVPISSFYLEMRAAAYMKTQSSVVYPADLTYFLNSLQRNGLAAMNDPTGNTGRIQPCSSDANLAAAKSRLDTAVTRASNAYIYVDQGNTKAAFEQWDLLFNGNFPSYYV